MVRRYPKWLLPSFALFLGGGIVLIGLVIVMSMWEWAHGRDGTPYSQLGAIAGVVYVIALAALRFRR